MMMEHNKLVKGMTVTDNAGRYLGIVVKEYDTTIPSYYIRYWSTLHAKHLHYSRAANLVKVLDDAEVREKTVEDPKTPEWWELYSLVALELAVSTNDREWFYEIHAGLSQARKTLIEKAENA